MQTIAWRWVDSLPYGQPARSWWSPPVLELNAGLWSTLSLFDRRRVWLHELGHHATAQFPAYWWPRAWERRCEALADRWALKIWIPDAAVVEAVIDGCCEVWQFACRWECSWEWARRRIWLFRAQHPEWEGRQSWSA